MALFDALRKKRDPQAAGSPGARDLFAAGAFAEAAAAAQADLAKADAAEPRNILGLVQLQSSNLAAALAEFARAVVRSQLMAQRALASFARLVGAANAGDSRRPDRSARRDTWPGGRWRRRRGAGSSGSLGGSTRTSRSGGRGGYLHLPDEPGRCDLSTGPRRGGMEVRRAGGAAPGRWGVRAGGNSLSLGREHPALRHPVTSGTSPAHIDRPDLRTSPRDGHCSIPSRPHDRRGTPRRGVPRGHR